MVETTQGGHEATAVILASGLTEGSLGLAGEGDLKGRGVSSCAHCDGPMFKDQPVVVVGGDDWAAQEAIELAGVASQVTLVCEGGVPNVSQARRERLSALANLSIKAGRVIALTANDAGLESVTVAGPGGEEQLTAQGVFVYTNRRPDIGYLAQAPRLDSTGRPMVGQDLATSSAGLFAIGDVRAGTRESVALAAEDGRMAAQAAVFHCRSMSGSSCNRVVTA
ncbi:MAG: NAD(P)/FAD-dependent oxidoreductase [Alphaproteobacteria bacterium]